MFAKSLVVDAVRFELLGEQRGGAAVYRGENAYLRLGETQMILHALTLHREMEKAKYPVAPIISQGEIGAQSYFIEKSLGTRSFRAIFQEDFERDGHIADQNFMALVTILKKLHGAQAKFAGRAWSADEFAGGIRLPSLCSELPDHAHALRERFTAAAVRLQNLPGSLTHGDCNPANIYEEGIIDLEDSFYGPSGYDVISALTSIEWSPRTREYEFYAHYRFSDEQKEVYLKTFALVAAHAKDLSFTRAVWVCSGMGKWPRLQHWRFEKLVKDFLS